MSRIKTEVDYYSIPKKKNYFVFLAGPCAASSAWRESLPDIDGITWIDPRNDNYDGDYDRQVKWETAFLRISDIVLFWIPPKIEEISDYARTTRIEFGEILGRQVKRVVCGVDDEIGGRQYFVDKMKYYNQGEVYNSLQDCVNKVKEIIEEDKKKDKLYFTADTHFGSDRALELSKRPFGSVDLMDWGMVERWNSKVTPDSIVYHLGDFGDYKYLKYLNGNIILLLGNYERDQKNPLSFYTSTGFYNAIDEKEFVIHDFKSGDSYTLVHEPENTKEKKSVLFGHIHGRQKIKKMGMDVGVDSNNFYPYSISDVKFYMTAIDKYYDKNVFMDNGN